MFETLSIDWGSIRYGLAFGNTETGLIIPDRENRFTSNIIEDIETILKEKNITKIIVGLPTSFDYKPTEITFKIQDFVELLKLTFPSLEIFTVNERGSTKESMDLDMKNNHDINHISAVKILERYLAKS